MSFTRFSRSAREVVDSPSAPRGRVAVFLPRLCCSSLQFACATTAMTIAMMASETMFAGVISRRIALTYRGFRVELPGQAARIRQRNVRERRPVRHVVAVDAVAEAAHVRAKKNSR